MWRDAQQEFASALLDPTRPVPAGVASSEHRFAVYRNNVTVGLRDALADTFPVVREIVGEEFFDGMAQVFVRRSPPRTPVLIDYGCGFPDFIETFDPAAGLPYLADVARLEWAWTRAYHAADAPPVGIGTLAAFPPEQAADARLVLPPSLRTLVSAWPVVSIWQAHQSEGTGTAIAERGEAALIFRPGLDVEVRGVDESTCAFLTALSDGLTLGEIAGQFQDGYDFDLARHIGAVFELGAVVDIQISEGGHR